jgi:hypothetical protein
VTNELRNCGSHVPGRCSALGASVHSEKELTAEPLRGTIHPLRSLEHLQTCGSGRMEPIGCAAADGAARAAGIAAFSLERFPAKACPGAGWLLIESICQRVTSPLPQAER